MPRTELIPVVSADGRTIILQAIPLTPRERLRRLAERLRPGPGRRRK
jgi:hypothetical protein